MDVQAYIAAKGDLSFEELKGDLRKAPLYLEVRDKDDLFTLMFSKDSPADHPVVRQSVGPVFDKAHRRLRAYALARTDEVVLDGPDAAEPAASLPGFLQNDWQAAKCVKYVEGTKVTVYCYQGKWRISTTRALDACQSFWGSQKSFGQMFLEACALLHPGLASQLSGQVQGSDGPLDTTASYVFILSTPEHRFIQAIKSPSILHVATFDLDALQYKAVDIGVPQQSIQPFATPEDFRRHIISSSEQEPTDAGFLVMHGERRVRVMARAYKYIQGLRGHTPNQVHHYLEMRQGDDYLAFHGLLYFYPEFGVVQVWVERAIHDLARLIHQLYVKFFIEHSARPHLDKTLFVTLMQVHAEYRRTHRKRTLPLIYSHLTVLPAPILLRLLTLDGRQSAL